MLRESVQAECANTLILLIRPTVTHTEKVITEASGCRAEDSGLVNVRGFWE